MTLEALQSNAQVVEARLELDRRDLSFVTPRWKAWLLRYRLLSGMRIGDHLKSWDVLKTIKLIEDRMPKNADILDIGAYASEVPLILLRLGFQRIAGLDLNSNILKMPHAGKIDYRIGDFLEAPFSDSSFDAITAISVIEHGLQMERLIAEMSRLLKTGGFFIASFDYWPEKIATNGIKMFGMSWTIFSRQDVEKFVGVAGDYGLVPCGPLSFATADRPVSCADRDYTFGWMALKKQ